VDRDSQEEVIWQLPPIIELCEVTLGVESVNSRRRPVLDAMLLENRHDRRGGFLRDRHRHRADEVDSRRLTKSAPCEIVVEQQCGLVGRAWTLEERAEYTYDDGSAGEPGQCIAGMLGTGDRAGCGTLNVDAAVKDAESLPGTSVSPSGSMVVGPNQINEVVAPNTTLSHTITVTNASSSSEVVNLSTRYALAAPLPTSTRSGEQKSLTSLCTRGTAP
jgi:hypothetical protein